MKKEIVGFSSVSDDELMNVDGGFWEYVVAAVVVFIAINIINPQKAY